MKLHSLILLAGIAFQPLYTVAQEWVDKTPELKIYQSVDNIENVKNSYDKNLQSYPEEDLTITVNGNSSYFNATIVPISGENSYNILSHTNPNCMYETTSACRKGQLAYTRTGLTDNLKRKFSFSFKINQMWLSPEWVIIFQDWVRLYHDDANGNRPLTTIKIRSFGGRLFLQHWDNAWQWYYKPTYPNDPPKYDTHLVAGMERMNGEIEITRYTEHSLTIIMEDSVGSNGDGTVEVFVDGIRISNATYRNSHMDSVHTVMQGLYWSSGFNMEHDIVNRIDFDIYEIKYEEME